MDYLNFLKKNSAFSNPRGHNILVNMSKHTVSKPSKQLK